jgi:hypothetical protein
MARLTRADVFDPSEIAAVHCIGRTVRRCFLFGQDPLSGKNYDHRKVWIENELRRLAANMGIDLLCFSLMSTHFHLVLRSRPDVVLSWDDTEVARRWLMLCPLRKTADGTAEEPSEAELNGIRNDADKLKIIRARLSDISWWMRLLCQTIAQMANREEGETGKFFQSRFRSVRLLDEEAILACAAYVDLNPIRAAIAETLETSDFTSVQRRMDAAGGSLDSGDESSVSQPERAVPSSEFLSPLEIDELLDATGACLSATGQRASAKGFLAMPTASYLELLEWTSRRLVAGKRGSTPDSTPAIFERLRIRPEVWCELVSEFGRMFSVVAGQPHRIDEHRSRQGRRFRMRRQARELLAG